MLKRLLVPMLVLTLAGVTSAGCHDNSGDGTNKPSITGSAGSDGLTTMDAATDSEADATDAADTGADSAADTATADATGN